MGTREKLFRQKLADQIENLLTQSEKVFTTEKLSNEWMELMLDNTKELTRSLTIYQFLHELPEDENLQIEFLELAEKEKEAEKEIDIPSYGDEIMKEIDEFDTQEAEDIEPVEEIKPVQKEQEGTIVDKTLSNTKEQEAVEEPISKTEQLDTEKATEINDSIAKNEASLADKLRKKSIKKLAESIALNERFLFSNELFNGNMEAFKQALNELDHIASLEDARRFIEVQLKEQNGWQMDSEIVQGFILLVERRFN